MESPSPVSAPYRCIEDEGLVIPIPTLPEESMRIRSVLPALENNISPVYLIFPWSGSAVYPKFNCDKVPLPSPLFKFKVAVAPLPA